MPDDMPAVLTLLAGAALPTADLASIARLQTWVAKGTESIVGVIALEPFGTSALLRSLAVAPESRRFGVGRELVARLERDATMDGVEQLVLLTETAQEFFRGLGYRVIDRRSVSAPVQQSAEFSSLCPAAAVCMTKALNPHKDASQ